MSQPYYQDDAVTIYHGDCREILPELPKMDLVLTDPPYFVPVQSYVGTRGRPYRKKMLGDLSVLSGYFDGFFDDLGERVNDTGTYYVFCDAKSYPVFWRSMYPWCKHVRLLIWDKLVSFNGYTWRHQHELIAWGELENSERVSTGDGDVLACRGVLQEQRHHPAEKPVELLKKLIVKHKAEQSVFDPFMGSGSSLRAAKDLGCKAIGIEIEEEYCEVAAKRMAQEVLSL